MEERVKKLEEKVAALEVRIQEQPSNEMITMESTFKGEGPHEMLKAYDPKK